MGTLNKFAGKIKSFFGIRNTAAKNSEKSFNRAMETAAAEAIEKRAEKKGEPDKAVRVLKKGHRYKPSSKPPWWVKFYGKRKRSEVGPLNLHMVGHFGGFSPVKKIGD